MGLIVKYLILQPKRSLLVFLTLPRFCCYPSSKRRCISDCHVVILKYLSENFDNKDHMALVFLPPHKMAK
jgi:hypothetical protein